MPHLWRRSAKTWFFHNPSSTGNCEHFWAILRNFELLWHLVFSTTTWLFLWPKFDHLRKYMTGSYGMTEKAKIWKIEMFIRSKSLTPCLNFTLFIVARLLPCRDMHFDIGSTYLANVFIVSFRRWPWRHAPRSSGTLFVFFKPPPISPLFSHTPASGSLASRLSGPQPGIGPKRRCPSEQQPHPGLL